MNDAVTEIDSTANEVRKVCQPDPPHCLAILEAGVRKSSDMKRAMSAVMADLASGRLTAGIGNAICNAGGKMLKTVELEQKYGTKSGDGEKTLLLTDVQ